MKLRPRRYLSPLWGTKAVGWNAGRVDWGHEERAGFEQIGIERVKNILSMIGNWQELVSCCVVGRTTTHVRDVRDQKLALSKARTIEASESGQAKSPSSPHEERTKNQLGQLEDHGIAMSKFFIRKWEQVDQAKRSAVVGENFEAALEAHRQLCGLKVAREELSRWEGERWGGRLGGFALSLKMIRKLVFLRWLCGVSCALRFFRCGGKK